MNNKELYKACFSKLHTSTDLEADNMEKIGFRVVGKRIVTICAVIMAVVLVTTGGTYAITGGKTANLFEAYEIFVNGVNAQDRMVEDENGSYSIKLGADEEFTIQNETMKATVKVPENPVERDITVKFSPDAEQDININVGE